MSTITEEQFRAYSKELTLLSKDAGVSPLEYMLRLEKIDENLYRSLHPLITFTGARGIFGGAVVAQSLLAAIETVNKDFHPHSLHSYFTLAGVWTKPVVYHVERVRDGRTFATRTVEAKQDGKAIFTITISFARPEKTQFHHETPHSPNMLSPEAAFAARTEFSRYHSDGVAQVALFNMSKTPQTAYTIAMNTINSNSIDAVDISQNEVTLANHLSIYECLDRDPKVPPSERELQLWYRISGKIVDPKFHAVALAYLSDRSLLITAPLANDCKVRDISMMVSLDHSVYFHGPIQADDYNYMEVTSPWAGCRRGLVEGRLYTKAGHHIATCYQEGVVRIKEPTSRL